MTLSFPQYFTIYSTALLVGMAVGALIFDMFVSRPTLRILNEEIKLRENNYQTLVTAYNELNFKHNNLKRIKQEDNIGNHK